VRSTSSVTELEEDAMSIVGGFDLHRKQLTFDYVDRATGELQRGQITPADRRHLAVWLRRFDGVSDVEFAVEGCTGWRWRNYRGRGEGAAGRAGPRKICVTD
jgi:hypothetical protein